MSDMCEPYICSFPSPEATKSGTRWICPKCGHRYRLTRPAHERPWRNWSAPNGARKVRRWL